MISTLGNRYKLQYTEMEIAQQIARLGDEIGEWAAPTYGATGRDVLAIPLLRGGIFFFAALMPRVRCSVEMAPGRTRAYQKGENNSQLDTVEIQLDGVSVAGRTVLLVDDICDSGRTLKVLTEHLHAQGAADVRSAVLIKREHDKSVFDPNWVGFTYYGPEWFVGFGMDDGDRYSNLPSIYTIAAN